MFKPFLIVQFYIASIVPLKQEFIFFTVDFWHLFIAKRERNLITLGGGYYSKITDRLYTESLLKLIWIFSILCM